MNTQRIIPGSELKFAKGMVERRRDIADEIGSETDVAQAIDNYRSMLACLKECEKHHNRVMSVIDDRTAGYGIETSALVDWSRKWVRQSESLLVEKWNIPQSRIDETRQGVMNNVRL